MRVDFRSASRAEDALRFVFVDPPGSTDPMTSERHDRTTRIAPHERTVRRQVDGTRFAVLAVKASPTAPLSRGGSTWIPAESLTKGFTHMKSILGHALVLATVLAVPAVMADETKTKSTSTTTTTSDPAVHHDATGTTTGTSTEGATTTTSTDGTTTEGVKETTTTQSTTTAPVEDPWYGAKPPRAYGGGPTTTTSTTTHTSGVAHDDALVIAHKEDDDRPRVKSGIGFNVFGAAGARDSARLGLGARIEFVMPFGLTLGGSYTQHWEAEGGRTGVRPLLGEVGVALPVAKRLELRPMVGLGYAFVSSSGSNDATAVNDSTTTTNATVRTSGFDIAPGAKISYLAGNVIELYTLPKYHFISGNNFAGVELGAGARF